MPIGLKSVAIKKTRQGTRSVRIEIALIEFRVRNSDGLIEDAVERHQMRRPAGEELLIGFGAPQGLRPEEVIAGEEQRRVDVASDQADIEIVR